ncbi:hypothetical protein C0992_002565 [Termitomyces sp. T32_za158]|nr:hypothetical protein C0992_002565 [Termitomyces sp. T32_za158]
MALMPVLTSTSIMQTVETLLLKVPYQQILVHVTWGVLETRRKMISPLFLLLLTCVFSQACGGPNRVSVYSSTGNVTILPVPTPLQTGLPANWQYKGCLRFPENGVKALPYKIVWPTNNTALACVSQCAAFGFPASGVEGKFPTLAFQIAVTRPTPSQMVQSSEKDQSATCPAQETLSHSAVLAIG